MVRFVVLFLLLNMCSTTTQPSEPPNIVDLNATFYKNRRSAMLLGDTPHVLVLGKQFKIRVQSIEEVEEIRCYDSSYSVKLFDRYFMSKELSESNNSQTVLAPVKAEAVMNGTWYCMIFYKGLPDDPGTRFQINVTVIKLNESYVTTGAPKTTPSATVSELPSTNTKRTDVTTGAPETTPIAAVSELPSTNAKRKCQYPRETGDQNFSTRTEVTSVKPTPLREGKEQNIFPNGVFLTVIIAVTVIVITIVICLVVGFYRRKRKSELAKASDGNYENLPGHNAGPMPVPSQWNDYARPSGFEPRTQDETYYSVPHVEKAPEVTYSNQKQLNNETRQLEPNYAVVAPKGRKGSSCEYANLNQKSTQAQSEANKVLPENQHLYAKVLPKISPKPNSTYANLSNQLYANTAQQRTSEYAESAYCEPRNL